MKFKLVKMYLSVAITFLSLLFSILTNDAQQSSLMTAISVIFGVLTIHFYSTLNQNNYDRHEKV